MESQSRAIYINKQRKKDKLRLLYSYMHMLDGGFYDYIQKSYPTHLIKNSKSRVRFV